MPTKIPLLRLHLDWILKTSNQGSLEIFFCGWNIALSLYEHKTRHCLCSQPSSLVQLQSQAVSCISCKDDHQVSQTKASLSPLPLISRLIVMWMLTLLGYMEENLRSYLQVALSYRIHHVLLLLPSHLEKLTSNRNCTQHLPCRICCPIISHPKNHPHPTGPPRTCTLSTHDLHNSCHPC